ncbi:MAG: DUF5011 domain-containing protein [Candidatus Izemoplasma sp.]
MKLLKLGLIGLFIFTLSGCSFFGDDSYKNSDSDHLVLIRDTMDTEFEVGDAVPNFKYHYQFVDFLAIESYEITTNLPEGEIFNTIGFYKVEMEIIDLDGKVYLKVFVIEVIERAAADYSTTLKRALVKLDEAYYLQMEYINKIEISSDGVNQTYLDNTSIKYFIDVKTGANLFHGRTDVEFGGQSDYIEGYLTIGPAYVNIFTSSIESDYKFIYEEVPFNDYINSTYYIGEMYYGDLLNGIETIDATHVEGDIVTIEIPLTNDNFDYNIALPIIEGIGFLEIYDISSNEFRSLLADNVDKVKLTVKMNKDTSYITEVEYDYTMLIQYLIDQSGYGLINLASDSNDVVVQNAILTEHEFDYKSFSFEIPIEVIYGEFQSMNREYIFIDTKILDIVLDNENNTLYYTLENDHTLYKYNFETKEYSEMIFDGVPEHLYLKDDLLYVTLRMGVHSRYRFGPYEGAFAEIDTTNFSIHNHFNIFFDPWDIVVDEEGYVYISSGSGQSTEIRSFNGVTGQAIDSVSAYANGQLLFSDATNHLYYIEMGTTYQNITVYKLSSGLFVGVSSGTDDYFKNNLTMAPDGLSIYEIKGNIITLSPDFFSDARVVEYSGIEFDAMAFDYNSDLRFYLFGNILTAVLLDGSIDYSFLLTDVNEYRSPSEYQITDPWLRLLGGDDVLINITDNFIEIVDQQVAGDDYEVSLFKNLNINDTFNPLEYVTSSFGNYITLEYLSGEYDISNFGVYTIEYVATSIYDTSYTFKLILTIGVGDNSGPTITINSGNNTIVLGEEYTPSGCTAVDNFDPNPTCEVLVNNVDSSVMGVYEVIYLATDNEGNTTTKSELITVVLTTTGINYERVDFGVSASDVIIDESTNQIFYTSVLTKRVYSYNYITKETKEIVFTYMPENMFLDGGTLYVNIVMDEHSSYWWEDEQVGKIAVINTADFTLIDLFEIDVDPYGIIVKDGLIYIAPGSAQWVTLEVFDASTGVYVGSSCGLREKTLLYLEESTGNIYSITNLSIRDIEKFVIDGTSCLEQTETPYHGDYNIGDSLFISPEKDYIFTTNGLYFHYGDFVNTELSYAGDLEFEFRTIYFDIDNNLMYVGQANGLIYISEIGEYNTLYQYNIGYSIDELYVGESVMYIVSFDTVTQSTVLLITSESN